MSRTILRLDQGCSECGHLAASPVGIGGERSYVSSPLRTPTHRPGYHCRARGLNLGAPSGQVPCLIDNCLPSSSHSAWPKVGSKSVLNWIELSCPETYL